MMMMVSSIRLPLISSFFTTTTSIIIFADGELKNEMRGEKEKEERDVT